jgi:hypothetical protein
MFNLSENLKHFEVQSIFFPGGILSLTKNLVKYGIGEGYLILLDEDNSFLKTLEQ